MSTAVVDASETSRALRTRLLTTLNASSARPSALKRKHVGGHNDWHAIAKRVRLEEHALEEARAPGEAAASEQNAPDEQEDDTDGFAQHFAAETSLLTPATLAACEQPAWQSTTSATALGRTNHAQFVDAILPLLAKAKPVAKLLSKVKAQNNGTIPPIATALLDEISMYRDVLHSHTQLGTEHEQLRAATALHVMSHIAKGQRRVLANNEAISKAKAAKAELDLSVEVRDQGFTRPKVLILLPFRNSALAWVIHLSRVALAVQIENQARFQTEFSLPEDVVDKLAEPDAVQRYPADHIATFRGNIDDSFRVGLKATRKSLRVFSEFYGSDIIVASPLGLRKSIDASGDSDFLSSIEIVVADQLDVMLMQNWDHVKFLFERLNKLPESPRDTDYSRVKPWYLDGRAAHLRQTLLLSAFETPEIRALFTRSLCNVAGRVHLAAPATDTAGLLHLVRAGVKQSFTRFDAADPVAEEDARFETFTTKTLPMLLKSAVMSSRTLVFVPSYFDFVRLREHMKGLTDFDFAAISEYSAGSDVARARTYFQTGRKAFLVVTERFHFFRRFRIRGARTVVFYGLPDHATFYPELVNAPFVATGGEEPPDEGEVSVHALFSRYDALRLGRIVGEADARRMCTEEGAARFFFA